MKYYECTCANQLPTRNIMRAELMLLIGLFLIILYATIIVLYMYKKLCICADQFSI